MVNWDRQFIDDLLSSKDYRTFLRFFFKDSRPPRSKPKPSTYAEIARRAGFSSRAYVRDIVTGSKRVNSSNVERMADAIRLRAGLREYFYALVKLSGDLRDANSSKVDRHTLASIRSKVLKAQALRDIPVNLANLDKGLRPFFSVIPSVFAASGNTEKGASLEEIQVRTRQKRERLDPILQAMVHSGLLKVVEGRYFPCDGHIAMDKLGGDFYFKADFERAVHLALRRFPNQSPTSLALFLSSTFCVREKDLVELRNKLRTLILDYVTAAEESEGDLIAEIVVAFSSNHSDPKPV